MQHLRTRQGLQMVHGLRNEICRDGDPFQVDRTGVLTSEFNAMSDEDMRELFARGVIVVGERIATHVKTMRWKLLFADEEAFITSENPVSAYHPTESRWGIGTMGVHVLFPLSPSLMMVMSNEQARHPYILKSINSSGVRSLNAMTIHSAEQFLYSHLPFEAVADLIQARKPNLGCSGDT